MIFIEGCDEFQHCKDFCWWGQKDSYKYGKSRVKNYLTLVHAKFLYFISHKSQPFHWRILAHNFTLGKGQPEKFSGIPVKGLILRISLCGRCKRLPVEFYYCRKNIFSKSEVNSKQSARFWPTHQFNHISESQSCELLSQSHTFYRMNCLLYSHTSKYTMCVTYGKSIYLFFIVAMEITNFFHWKWFHTWIRIEILRMTCY